MLKTEEAIHIASKEYPGGRLQLAKDLNKRAGAFNNRCNPKQEAHVVTVDDLRGTVRKTGNALPIQALCYEVGGVFLPLPRTEFPADTDLVDAIARLQTDFAETMTEIADAIRSGSIRTERAKKVMKEGLEDNQVLTEIVGHLYMMSDDREGPIEQEWEQLTAESCRHSLGT